MLVVSILFFGCSKSGEEQLSDANSELAKVYGDALGKIGEYQKGVDEASGIPYDVLDSIAEENGK